MCVNGTSSTSFCICVCMCIGQKIWNPLTLAAEGGKWASSTHMALQHSEKKRLWFCLGLVRRSTRFNKGSLQSIHLFTSRIRVAIGNLSWIWSPDNRALDVVLDPKNGALFLHSSSSNTIEANPCQIKCLLLLLLSKSRVATLAGSPATLDLPHWLASIFSSFPPHSRMTCLKSWEGSVGEEVVHLDEGGVPAFSLKAVSTRQKKSAHFMIRSSASLRSLSLRYTHVGKAELSDSVANHKGGLGLHLHSQVHVHIQEKSLLLFAFHSLSRLPCQRWL